MRKIIVSEFVSIDGLRVNLHLIESKPIPSGVVLMRYEPNRD